MESPISSYSNDTSNTLNASDSGWKKHSSTEKPLSGIEPGEEKGKFPKVLPPLKQKRRRREKRKWKMKEESEMVGGKLNGRGLVGVVLEIGSRLELRIRIVALSVWHRRPHSQWRTAPNQVVDSLSWSLLSVSSTKKRTFVFLKFSLRSQFHYIF